jgi:hypothetical protein
MKEPETRRTLPLGWRWVRLEDLVTKLRSGITTSGGRGEHQLPAAYIAWLEQIPTQPDERAL